MLAAGLVQTVSMHAFSPCTSGGKRQLRIFTELVVSFPFSSLERGQKQRSLLSPSTMGREKGESG